MSETPAQPQEPRDLKFHESARDLAVQQIRSYGEELVRQSVSTAESRRHPLVLTKDVQYASHASLMSAEIHFRSNSPASATTRPSGAMIEEMAGKASMTGGLLGVFLHGFVAEMLSSEPSAWAVAVYVVIGFIGVFGVFWSLIR